MSNFNNLQSGIYEPQQNTIRLILNRLTCVSIPSSIKWEYNNSTIGWLVGLNELFFVEECLAPSKFKTC